MPHRFDSVLKNLMVKHAGNFLRFFDLDPTLKTRVLDSDISTVSGSADRVLLIEDQEPWILHLEFQASSDADLGRRMARYNILLEEQHKVPVKSVVFLLRKKALNSKVTGEFRSAITGHPHHLSFNYSVVKLWMLSPEELMSYGVGLMPLIALTNVSVEELPKWIRRVEDEIAKEPNVIDPGEFWTATKILAGLLYPAAVANKLFKGVLDMRESSVYREIEEQGLAKGLAMGLAEGRAKGRVEGTIQAAREILILQGADLFGDPDSDVLARLGEISNQTVLRQLAKRVLHVRSWDELLQTEN